MAGALAFVCLLATVLQAAAGDGATSAGTVIANRADATYVDPDGNRYATSSPTVVVTIAAVPALVVTPDDASPSDIVAPNDRIFRTFRLCNTGNVADLYLPLRADATAPATVFAAYYDLDRSGTVTDADARITVGGTLTPRIASGECIGVIFVVDTGAVSPGTQLRLGFEARGTLAGPNGSFPSDEGAIVNSVGAGVVFRSADDASLPPSLLVAERTRAVVANGAGASFTYKFSFRNTGAVPARNALIVDDLPAEIDYVPETLRVNGRRVTDAADSDEGRAAGKHLEFRLPTVAADAVVRIEFDARLAAPLRAGRGVSNVAAVAAENAPAAESNAAVVVVEPSGLVYAGSSAGAVRIPNARVTLSTPAAEDAALALEPATGLAPNPENANPFESAADGAFNFALAPGQLGTPSAPAVYRVAASAPNFKPRRLELRVTPTANGLFDLRVAALDGQSLATADGFGLTAGPVDYAGLAALVFNIPMFEVSTLAVTKNADRPFAEIGDIVTYRVQVRNAAASPLRGVLVRDALPPGFVYAEGTAVTDSGVKLRTEMLGGTLMFDIGDLASGATSAFTYRVKVGASAAEGDQFNTATAQGWLPNGDTASTAPARAGVKVRGGIFSLTQSVIGRVFEDANGNGRFDDGERAIPGARIYLDNGASVVTDPNGNFSFPAVDSGSLVASLDPVTLPDGLVLLDDDGRRSSKSWTRLLRTPLGGGTLLRLNFALGRRDPLPAPTPAAANDSDPSTVRVADKPLPRSNPKSPFANPERKAGTYTEVMTADVAKVAPGEVILVSPRQDEVLMAPALALNARVAKGWTVEASVNGAKVPATSLGETRVDNRNGVTDYSYVGIGVRPGANTLTLTPVGPDGTRGKSIDSTIYGRGQAERLELVTVADAPSGPRSVTLYVRGFDRWGHPAADGQVVVQTSAGRLLAPGAEPAENADSKSFTTSFADGAARVVLLGDGATSVARVKAVSGGGEAEADVRFAAELRPAILVGLAEASIGRSAPEIVNGGDERAWKPRLALFYRGRLFGDSLLTLSYDSSRALNRFGGRDRFGAQDPLDRAYPLFGDTSQRFEDAPSNSKLYARLDRGLSYAMFGDMEADMDRSTLAGYNRRLTGVKLHLERQNGDFVSLTGARPDTAFARDVFPGGGLSLVRLSHADILPGSEILTLETRDRRSPEIVVSRETLVRSVDYNLDSLSGELFFLRPVAAFDFNFNLVQVTAVYEYRADGSANYVYTGRASKNLARLGLRVGGSYVDQRQDEIGAFRLGGIDAEKTLWKGGRLTFEAALSRGRFASGVNVFDFYNSNAAGFVETDAGRVHDGLALALRLDQPLPWRGRLRAEFTDASRDFFNPFGGTVQSGSRRFNAAWEIRPNARRGFTLGFTREDNKSANVDNSRLTFSGFWTEQWRDNLRTTVGYDHRVLSDDIGDRKTDSNLVTAGVEFKPTKKTEISARREQNLSEADPTYPDQTTFAVKYEIDPNARLFITQRIASAPITPIGDFAGAGFAATRARSETAFGIETKLRGVGSLNGRYQLENGANGVDSFAVVGLQNRWNPRKTLGVEIGFERGFLLRGEGESFNSGTLGATWTPSDGFRATARWELRDRNGFGQMFTLGAAGRIGDGGWTTLARGQWAQTRFSGRRAFSSNVTAATAYRPVRSDDFALLFSYNRRELFQEGDATASGARLADMRDRYDTLSSDGLVSPFGGMELYGRFALRFAGNGNNSTAYASALTLLGQFRAQQRLGGFFDLAGETRWLAQPSSSTMRRSYGAELGFWAMPDLRFGVGYGYSERRFGTAAIPGANVRNGVYFTITSKLSRLFNLFGTSPNGLATPDAAPVQPVRVADARPKDEDDEEERREDDERFQR